MRIKARHTFFFLTAIFLFYSFSIYLKPLRENRSESYNRKVAADGRLVWQKYSCQSCHQLYGLGGYLGPDLTNLMSQTGKGEDFLRIMLKTGTKQMPSFSLSEVEVEELTEFLKSTDASGKADPRNFKRNEFGMIEANEKK